MGRPSEYTPEFREQAPTGPTDLVLDAVSTALSRPFLEEKVRAETERYVPVGANCCMRGTTSAIELTTRVGR